MWPAAYALTTIREEARAMATAHPTASGPTAGNTIHDLIAVEYAAWKAASDASEPGGDPARQEELEARAHEATAAVLEARPTDLPSMAAQLRWIAGELANEEGMDRYAAPIEPIADRFEAMGA
jgi:hypothetical protein